MHDFLRKISKKFPGVKTTRSPWRERTTPAAPTLSSGGQAPPGQDTDHLLVPPLGWTQIGADAGIYRPANGGPWNSVTPVEASKSRMMPAADSQEIWRYV